MRISKSCGLSADADATTRYISSNCYTSAELYQLANRRADTMSAGIGDNSREIGDNSTENGDNSTENGDDATGIVNIAAKVIPC